MNRLREIRKQRRITQQELGRAVGKYQSYIHNIEKGYYTPSMQEKEYLAMSLELKVTDIFPNE